MKTNKRILRYFKTMLLAILALFFVGSCEDFIDVDMPVNELITSKVFTDDITANSAMLGLYARMAYEGGPFTGGQTGISLLCGLASDELEWNNDFDIETRQFSENTLLATNSIITSLWNQSYEHIYYCNSIIEGINKSSGLSANLKDQLMGEALFLRAFVHFYLVNLFGDIPYIMTTNYEINTIANRVSSSEVYELIIGDLNKGKALMVDDYFLSNTTRSRASRYAAAALLARVYLCVGEWSKAEAEASEVIGNSMFTLEHIENVFQIDSKESIWQLENLPGRNYTNDGNWFVAPETNYYSPVSNSLFNAFQPEDLRFENWILEVTDGNNYKYVPYKYKDDYNSTDLKELSIVLRLGEQYLIRAEARVQQDNLLGINSAESDLNLIRSRAGRDSVQVTSKEDLLNSILEERRIEFFSEWGLRWIDLKRKGLIDSILGSVKPQWSSTDKLFPIPYTETLINTNLGQNDGYK